MAYAIAGSPGRISSLHRRTRNKGEALDPARGIVGWTLISLLVFWVPLGVALLR